MSLLWNILGNLMDGQTNSSNKGTGMGSMRNRRYELDKWKYNKEDGCKYCYYRFCYIENNYSEQFVPDYYDNGMLVDEGGMSISYEQLKKEHPELEVTVEIEWPSGKRGVISIPDEEFLYRMGEIESPRKRTRRIFPSGSDKIKKPVYIVFDSENDITHVHTNSRIGSVGCIVNDMMKIKYLSSEFREIPEMAEIFKAIGNNGVVKISDDCGRKFESGFVWVPLSVFEEKGIKYRLVVEDRNEELCIWGVKDVSLDELFE